MTARSLRNFRANSLRSKARRVAKTDRDEYLLNDLTVAGIPPVSEQPPTYENLVVLKPWGWEFECFNDGASSMWFLHIKAGHASSFHCHPKKETVFIPVDGEGMCGTLTRNWFIKPGDALIIERGVFHTPSAPLSEDLLLIEWETPADKTDLVRRRDRYGRENEPYEGKSRMVTEDLGRYGYFRFTELP